MFQTFFSENGAYCILVAQVDAQRVRLERLVARGVRDGVPRGCLKPVT